jgi:hypothetical protein
MDPRFFPIQELTQHTIDYAKTQTELSKDYLAMEARTTAALVSYIAMGSPEDWSAEQIKDRAERGMPDPIWEILAKHDPKRFGLEGLQMTQDANRLLLSD